MGNLVAKSAKGRGVTRSSGARDSIRTGASKGVATRTSSGSRTTAVGKAPAKPAKAAKPATTTRGQVSAKAVPVRVVASAKVERTKGVTPVRAKPSNAVVAKAKPAPAQKAKPVAAKAPRASSAAVTTNSRAARKTSAPAMARVTKRDPVTPVKAAVVPTKKSLPASPKGASPARAASPVPVRRETRNGKNGSNGHHLPAPHGDAVKAFEAALGVFNRGNFAAARSAFQKIVDTHGRHTEIIARCTMYLAVCSRRTQPAATVPRTPDSLYDRGIVEINRGQFDAAIALFEKALKAHPTKTGHLLYALAAAQVRAGRVDEGLRNLERAMESHDVCRSQARQDPDFSTVWGHDRFQEIVGDPYEMW
jgi:hypothetical protein